MPLTFLPLPVPPWQLCAKQCTCPLWSRLFELRVVEVALLCPHFPAVKLCVMAFVVPVMKILSYVNCVGVNVTYYLFVYVFRISRKVQIIYLL